LWILSCQRQRYGACVIWPDGIRGCSAVRTGPDRRPVLARSQPPRRGSGPDHWILGVGLYLAAANLDRCRMAEPGLADARSVRYVVAAPSTAFWRRGLGSADAWHVLVASAQ